jgi:hypothetical protein
MNSRLESEITGVLSKIPIVRNLSRKKFIGLFVLGLIKSRNVQFCEVAHHLNNEAKLSSNEVRIQDFFREVDIDYFYVALLLLQFLPAKKKLRLCIDRTERYAAAVGFWVMSNKYFDGSSGLWRLSTSFILGNVG